MERVYAHDADSISDGHAQASASARRSSSLSEQRRDLTGTRHEHDLSAAMNKGRDLTAAQQREQAKRLSVRGSRMKSRDLSAPLGGSSPHHLEADFAVPGLAVA